MARRKHKRSRRFGLPPSEHAHDADLLIAAAAGHIYGAEQAFERGQCVRAGSAIDAAYYTLGEAIGHIQGAGSGPNVGWKETYARLRAIDVPFEKKCVKRRPS